MRRMILLIFAARPAFVLFLPGPDSRLFRRGLGNGRILLGPSGLSHVSPPTQNVGCAPGRARACRSLANQQHRKRSTCTLTCTSMTAAPAVSVNGIGARA